MARVVVVGGGLSGMAVSVRLAKLGHDVTLCEKSYRLGGAIGFVEQDGFRWDAGPATTTLPAVLRDLFRKSGRPLERVLELEPVNPVRRHRFEDGNTLDLDLYAGSRAEQLDAMSEVLSPAHALRWAEFVDSLAPVWQALRSHTLEQPFTGCQALDKQTRRVLDGRQTLRRLTRKQFRGPRLASLLEHPTVMAGSDPKTTPGFVAVEAYVERTFGVWRPVGGMSALVDALTTRLDERGVDVRLGTEVLEIDCDGDAVNHVLLADERLDTDIVIAAGLDPRHFIRTLVHARSARPLARRIRTTTPAIPPAVTHVGLTPDVPDLPAEMVLHGMPTIVVRSTDQAPGDAKAWTIIRRGATDEDVLTTMAGRGLDVRAYVTHRLDRSPVEIVAEVSGSPYGIAWTGTRTAEQRLPNETPIRGLYCCGASAHPGAGLPQTGLGAALVAQIIGKA